MLLLRILLGDGQLSLVIFVRKPWTSPSNSVTVQGVMLQMMEVYIWKVSNYSTDEFVYAVKTKFRQRFFVFWQKYESVKWIININLQKRNNFEHFITRLGCRLESSSYYCKLRFCWSFLWPELGASIKVVQIYRTALSVPQLSVYHHE